MKYKFNIKEALKQGWDLTKKHFWLMLGIGVLSMLVSYAIEGVKYLFLGMSQHSGFMYLPYLLFLIAGFVASLILSFNTYRMIFDMIDGKGAKIMDLFKWDDTIAKRLGKWLLANIAVGLIVFVGFIFLIIPGIYFAIKYAYVNMLMVEKDMTIGEAFKKSADMTQGEKWHLLGLFAICVVAVIVGMLLLVVGIIPAIMIVAFANTLVYRKLAASAHAKVETV